MLGSMATALVILGSLTPFRFGDVASGTGMFDPARIGWLPAPAEDLAVNLLVYLPVGFTLYAWVRRIIPFRTPSVLAATLLGAVLSLSVETLQIASSARCASWVDVVLNTYGAFLGAATAPWLGRAVRPVILYVRQMVEESAMSFTALVMTTGLILHGTAPFDFALGADDVHRSLLSSGWWPIAERHVPMSLERILNPYGPLVSSIGVAGVFALLGGAYALSERSRGTGRRASILAAVGHAGVVSLAIETLQLFVRSHTFDTVDLAANPLAAALGAWMAVGVVDPTVERCGHSRPAAAVPGSIIAAAVLLQIAYALVSAFVSQGLSPVRPDGPYLCLAPFSVYFRMPFVQAAGRLVSEALPLSLLTATLGVYFWRRNGRIRWVFVAVVVVLVATTCEIARVQVLDPTAPIIALLAVIGCRAVHRRIGPPALRVAPV